AYAGMTTVGSAAIPVLLACLFVLVPLISSCGERGHVKPMGPQETRARAILRPKVSFSEASLEEMIEYFQTWTKDVELEKGVDGRFNIVPLDDAPGITINIDRKDITLHEALRICVAQAGMIVTYRDEAALVHKPDHLPQIVEVGSLLMARAKAIVLPQVDFDGATVAEAAGYFQTKSTELDPSHQGINIVIKPGLEKAKPITLYLKRIPLSEALYLAALQANVKLESEGNSLVLSPK
ncbi:MAG: Peptidase BlaR1, partial [Verrucomicrobiaceae bacterium]|nr:Peptidase BlaR1 [Verrucomicrobiaceae bacterium]